jgi:hypothetical protein
MTTATVGKLHPSVGNLLCHPEVLSQLQEWSRSPEFWVEIKEARRVGDILEKVPDSEVRSFSPVGGIRSLSWEAGEFRLIGTIEKDKITLDVVCGAEKKFAICALNVLARSIMEKRKETLKKLDNSLLKFTGCLILSLLSNGCAVYLGNQNGFDGSDKAFIVLTAGLFLYSGSKFLSIQKERQLLEESWRKI